MLFRKSALSVGCVVVLAALCGACGPALQATSTVPRSLSGNWRADPAHSREIDDRLHAALDSAAEKELRVATKRASKLFRSDDGTIDPHVAPYSWEVRDQKEQYQAIFEDVRPVTELKIVQAARQIQFSAPNVAQRNYEPGVTSTLVTTFANLKVASGWQQDVFVVHAKDSKNDVEITRRYQLRSDGSLLLSVVVSCKYMPTLQYSISYHNQ